MANGKCLKCRYKNNYKCFECVGYSMYEPMEYISYQGYYQNNGIPKSTKPSIKNVIFNAPATIVLWSDGTKTVVKSGDYDVYDPEKGLAMAIAKKALGNGGNYYEVFKAWLPEEDKSTSDSSFPNSERFREKLSELGKTLYEGINDGINKK